MTPQSPPWTPLYHSLLSQPFPMLWQTLYPHNRAIILRTANQWATASSKNQMCVVYVVSKVTRMTHWFTLVNVLDQSDMFIQTGKCFTSLPSSLYSLKSWLSHSQKRYCEICGHKYTFTKVYPDYIPPSIPSSVYVRQSLLWLVRMSLLVMRFWLVVAVWLGLLPSVNMITLRTIVWLADAM